MSEIRCKRCGSTKLDADPAGYYCDAYTEDGAPLLCLGKCKDDEEKNMNWSLEVKVVSI